MKKFAVLFAATAALAFAGCSAVETAQTFNDQKVADDKAIAHVSATTHGLYLLWIPLVTGSESEIGMPTLVQDTVSVPAITRMVTAKAKQLKSDKIVDFVSHAQSLGFLFYYKTQTASATALK